MAGGGGRVVSRRGPVPRAATPVCHAGAVTLIQALYAAVMGAPQLNPSVLWVTRK